MFRNCILLIALLINSIAEAQPQWKPSPDQLWQGLFTDVQLSGIFPDSKTFVDAVPTRPPHRILRRYHRQRHRKGFQLQQFVSRYFHLPPPAPPYQSQYADLRQHITALWPVLKRNADAHHKWSSLLPLPHPYIVPGGRFREIYYWDSYFTMLGLKESGEYALMENMVQNFAHLIKTYGFIPNGNRSYYLSRSQPPYFSLMVDLLAQVKGQEVYQQYAAVLEAERNYWIVQDAPAFTYHDALFSPRPESFAEDHATAEEAVMDFRKVVRMADTLLLRRITDSIYRSVCNNLRAAAASGWDFSSRWMRGDALHTTQMDLTEPVDLHCLLQHLRSVADKATQLRAGAYDSLGALVQMRQVDRPTLRKKFFNESLGWYCDFDLESQAVMNNPTLAGMYPLFFRLVDSSDVPRIVDFLKRNFLKDGGLVTSLQQSKQQWDAPNGWAPLHWIAIIGLENYGYHDLAKEIARRWVRLNKSVFEQAGRLMEKYDVVDLKRPAGGGEYPSQDGFGWTNGVLLALMNRYQFE